MSHDFDLRRAHRINKEDALAEAQVRHLLEVAFYAAPAQANAVKMWGEKEVREQLIEYEHYRALQQ